MVGPRRCGKGTIARILTTLLGRPNVAGPTLSSLSGEFGLQPLIGKPLAIVADARFSAKNTSSIVIERLLSISGEDTLTVNRKNREHWTGTLSTRLHILTNELPRLNDASSAIVSRMLLLNLSRSWLGKEDRTLEGRVRRELSGILNWSLVGLHRLIVENGNRFTVLASAEDAMLAMEDMASPVGAFVREMCTIDPNAEIRVDELYAQYKIWAEHSGHERKSRAVFGRDLRAVNPAIRKTRPGNDETRNHVYAGIRLSANCVAGEFRPSPDDIAF
jgi:putative DNA primase/helicase